MPTIALVDDDHNILTSVSIALEAEGYRITTYTDGVSALDGFRTTPPDLAILDIKMPRMDGMETLLRLRQKSDLPVIFLTSKDDCGESPPFVTCSIYAMRHAVYRTAHNVPRRLPRATHRNPPRMRSMCSNSIGRLDRAERRDQSRSHRRWRIQGTGFGYSAGVTGRQFD